MLTAYAWGGFWRGGRSQTPPLPLSQYVYHFIAAHFCLVFHFLSIPLSTHIYLFLVHSSLFLSLLFAISPSLVDIFYLTFSLSLSPCLSLVCGLHLCLFLSSSLFPCLSHLLQLEAEKPAWLIRFPSHKIWWVQLASEEEKAKFTDWHHHTLSLEDREDRVGFCISSSLSFLVSVSPLPFEVSCDYHRLWDGDLISWAGFSTSLIAVDGRGTHWSLCLSLHGSLCEECQGKTWSKTTCYYYSVDIILKCKKFINFLNSQFSKASARVRKATGHMSNWRRWNSDLLLCLHIYPWCSGLCKSTKTDS